MSVECAVNHMGTVVVNRLHSYVEIQSKSAYRLIRLDRIVAMAVQTLDESPTIFIILINDSEEWNVNTESSDEAIAIAKQIAGM